MPLFYQLQWAILEYLKQLGQLVSDFELSQLSLLAILTLLYIFLGCFLEGTSMMVLTASVVLPMVQTAGIDLIWFGIFTVDSG